MPCDCAIFGVFLKAMQTKVVKLDAEKIDSEEIKKAAKLVDSGALVAFPTETVYGIACRVETASLSRLNDLKGRQADKRYTLHIGRKTDVKKYVPSIGLRAEKLIRNAWPGPLTLVFELDQADINKQKNRLDKEVFENLYKDNSIGIRCPEDRIASKLLQLIKNSVVAPSANITGHSPATEPSQVLSQFAGRIELLLDAGACKYKKSSTVVKIGKKGLKILRDGVYSQSDLGTLSQIKFLFVCTGNTCRSPMAEGIFRKYLAEKLGCKVDQLKKKGYKLSSAGTVGLAGMPASPQTIAVCATKGIDLRAHKSRRLSPRLIEEYDFVFVMDRMQRQQILTLCPDVADKCVLLAENKDISDPIGRPKQVYNNCAKLIEQAVKNRIDELVI